MKLLHTMIRVKDVEKSIKFSLDKELSIAVTLALLMFNFKLKRSMKKIQYVILQENVANLVTLLFIMH